jgi:hypothetical protein
MYSSRVVMLLLEKPEDVYWALELRNGQRVKGIGGACSTSWKCQKWTVPCKNLEWISTLSDTIMCHRMRRICLDNFVIVWWHRVSLHKHGHPACCKPRL